MTAHRKKRLQLAICIRNEDHPVSLERRKIYRIIPDVEAAKHHQMRVIDESGEDYLYPEDFFIAVDLPESIERAVLQAT